MSEVETTLEEIRGILSEYEREFYERCKDLENFTICDLGDMRSALRKKLADSGSTMLIRLLVSIEDQVRAHNEAMALKRREAALKQTGVQR